VNLGSQAEMLFPLGESHPGGGLVVGIATPSIPAIVWNTAYPPPSRTYPEEWADVPRHRHDFLIPGHGSPGVHFVKHCGQPNDHSGPAGGLCQQGNLKEGIRAVPILL
jgi:hypothetical protein